MDLNRRPYERKNREGGFADLALAVIECGLNDLVGRDGKEERLELSNPRRALDAADWLEGDGAESASRGITFRELCEHLEIDSQKFLDKINLAKWKERAGESVREEVINPSRGRARGDWKKDLERGLR